ncbi:MAG: hypothetical protein ACLFQB_04520 [Chitinispirillaceae bacterium]
MNYVLIASIILAATAGLKAQDFPDPESPPPQTQLPRYEIGVVLGQPTGLSGKYWLSRRSAVDGVLAWAFSEGGRFEVHADYLFHYYFDVPQGNLPAYLGAGAAVYIRDETTVGARIPFGVSYIFDRAPLSAFLEIAPIVDLVPSTAFGISGGVGIRFAI